MTIVVLGGLLIVFLLSFAVGWIVFPYTVSGIQILTKSPLSILSARVSFAVAAAFFITYIVVEYLAG